MTDLSVVRDTWLVTFSNQIVFCIRFLSVAVIGLLGRLVLVTFRSVYKQVDKAFLLLLVLLFFNQSCLLGCGILLEGVHDLGQHKLHSEERTEDDHEAEVDD